MRSNSTISSRTNTQHRSISVKKVVLLFIVSILLVYVLTLLPVVFFGLSGNPEQNDKFFKDVQTYFVYPLAGIVFVSSLLAAKHPNKAHTQKAKLVSKLLVLISILIIGLMIWIHNKSNATVTSEKCLENRWQTSYWNYDTCSKLFR